MSCRPAELVAVSRVPAARSLGRAAEAATLGSEAQAAATLRAGAPVMAARWEPVVASTVARRARAAPVASTVVR
jgi:hypothetical protein